ncbi:hypothetical protein ES703_34727 [subsurface metagenome]
MKIKKRGKAKMSKWTLEQLTNLKDLEAQVSTLAKINIIPISKGGLDEGYGSSIIWDARVYKRGVMGPLPVEELVLIGAGVSEEEAKRWVAQTERAVSTLNRLYPVLLPAIEARVKAIEAAVPAALPAGHESTREVFEV